MFPGTDRLKQFQRLLVDTFYVLARFSRVAIDKVFDQQRNVLSSLSKGRYVNRENVQPIKQVAAEGPRANGGLQVAVSGSDHPDVSEDSTTAADTLKLVLPAELAGEQSASQLEALRLRRGRLCLHLPVQTDPGAAGSRP